MLRYGDQSFENGKDLVLGFETIFNLEVFVPESLAKEVESDSFSGALEESGVTSQLSVKKLERNG